MTMWIKCCLWYGVLCLPLVAWANDTPANKDSQGYVTCQIAEDGLTDDGPAINTCLKENPGRHIMLHKKGSASFGGGQATSKDIYSGETLTMIGDAQWLDCDIPALWAGGCRIDFNSRLNGPGIEVRPTAYGIEISNLELYGGNCWVSTDLTTYSLPPRINGIGNDGILLAGGEPKLVNVQVNCFKRHGISVMGDSAAYDPSKYGYSQPDFFRFERVAAAANRGYGVYITGGDSNAGLVTFVDARANQLGGIYDHSALGNTWISPGFHSNTRSPSPAGPPQAIAFIAIKDNVATITASDALSNTLTAVGSWVTTSGSDDNSFDGTCKVTAVHLDSRTLACLFHHTDGLAKHGNVQRAGTPSVFAIYASTPDGSGIPGNWKIAGPFSGRGGSSSTVVVNPYCESDEQTPDFGAKTLVLGGNCNVIDSRWSHGGIRAVNGGLELDTSGPGGISMWNHSDSVNLIRIRAGKNADQDTGLSLEGHDGQTKFSIYRTAGGSVFFRDSANKGVIPLSFYSGGPTEISASGLTSALNLQHASSGDLMFYSNAPTNTRMKSTGNFVFGDPTKPAITVETGKEYGVLYASGNNELGLGFTANATAKPSSPLATFDKTSGAHFEIGISSPKLAGVSDKAVVTNLNADMLDGKHANAFALAAISQVSFSATPSFDASIANTFEITLRGDVSHSTLANPTPGEHLVFIVCQDAMGNRRFAWPPNVKGGTIVGSKISTCSTQSFIFDGTNAYALTPGVVNQ